jgi:hypothetical protein
VTAASARRHGPSLLDLSRMIPRSLRGSLGEKQTCGKESSGSIVSPVVVRVKTEEVRQGAMDAEEPQNEQLDVLDYFNDSRLLCKIDSSIACFHQRGLSNAVSPDHHPNTLPLP